MAAGRSNAADACMTEAASRARPRACTIARTLAFPIACSIVYLLKRLFYCVCDGMQALTPASGRDCAAPRNAAPGTRALAPSKVRWWLHGPGLKFVSS